MKKSILKISAILLTVIVFFACSKNDNSQELSMIKNNVETLSRIMPQDVVLRNQAIYSPDHTQFLQSFNMPENWYDENDVQLYVVDASTIHLLFKSKEKNLSNSYQANYIYRAAFSLNGIGDTVFVGGTVMDFHQAQLTPRGIPTLVSGRISERLSSGYELTKYVNDEFGSTMIEEGDGLIIGPPVFDIAKTAPGLAGWWTCTANTYANFHNNLSNSKRLLCNLSDLVMGSCTLGTAISAGVWCATH